MPDNNEDFKKVTISGTNNRYQINKLIRDRKENKKRVNSLNWKFSDEYLEYHKQVELIEKIVSSNFTFENEVGKIAMQEIHKKIYGYKQQDMIKKIFQEKLFITFEDILHKMIDCKLKCHYCKENMIILYDISREMKQWSVDRIDNNIGHNKENFYLACLDCNLKRRRVSDTKFLFTKQLNITKQEA